MIGILIITSVAFFFGIIISILDKKASDSSEIESLLPGYNCGGCGYKGCADMAEAISKDPTLYVKCRALRGDNSEKMKEYLKNTYK